jgi:hypothetical protein
MPLLVSLSQTPSNLQVVNTLLHVVDVGPSGILDFLGVVGKYFSKEDPTSILPDLASANPDREDVRNFQGVFKCPTCSVLHFTNTITLNKDFQIVVSYNTSYLAVDAMLL